MLITPRAPAHRRGGVSGTGAVGIGLLVATAMLTAARAIHVAVDRRGA